MKKTAQANKSGLSIGSEYGSVPILNVADSDRDANQLYWSGIFVPDAFPLMVHPSRGVLGLFNPLEYARAKKESRCTEVWSTTEVIKHGREMGMKVDERPDEATVITIWAKLLEIKKFLVGHDFPIGLAEKLKAKKIRLEVFPGNICPQREIKTAEEWEAIREGNACSAHGMKKAKTVLREAEIGKGGKLWWQGRVLTSERLQEVIEKACLEKGGVAGRVIAAGGEQACDPHSVGEGPLRAHELIIVDIFPRLKASGYHGDMTRTFLKGKASPEQRRMVNAVLRAQKEAVAKVRTGASADLIHREIEAYFEAQGYRTKLDGENPEGFFHGTGHGLGLDVHEAPRVSRGAPVLREGQVVTIEPGLYFPGLGGCRIEDVVGVSGKGPVMLSSFSYNWEL